MDLQGVVADYNPGPYTRNDVVFGDELACRTNQKLEDVKGALAQNGRLTVHKELASFEVDFHRARLMHQPMRIKGQRKLSVKRSLSYIEI